MVKIVEEKKKNNKRDIFLIWNEKKNIIIQLNWII